ncbi:tRNA pseudouridine(38-40) synthase TruA [Caldibacillus lycopersici]|uniref:tRNA pseudouridine synthase A n=1 Tax=Perspicuibacillus lycopersici TaxID=1325689 RepID=A0AAE3IVY0_9BACI|nr:tRNA pseudouridine(38-40) synthase TruA [Perspicuibacillus lycopersici]MCU9615197.1 tRNA pseudouridine(38-40) synthase TruA [Perspicuibacillus lycopersici]
MKRIKCIVAYDGTHFQGYQVQPNKRTVQGEIEQVLAKMHKNQQVKIYASGRTDANVHAKGQVFHFDSSIFMGEDRWVMALNALLPEDIVILHAQYVANDFHARFSNHGKEYRYRILRKKERDPFLRNYTYHYPFPLNLEKMKQAMKILEGTHDFTSFCSAKTSVTDHIRTIESFTLIETAEELVFQIRGNGFLYNMVRIIVGTMLEVGAGKLQPENIPAILEGRDRSLAGKTVPGHGLYLWKVFY